MYEKKRFLVKTVFETARNEIPRGNKSSISSYLSSLFEERYGFERDERSYVRYYKTLVQENTDYNIDDVALDYLSKYIGYHNFEDFCDRVKLEDDNSETFSLSFKEISERIQQIIITVSPTILLPDFIRKNGLGLMEMTFVLLLVTGGVVFSKGKKPILEIGEDSAIEKPYMYWNGERFIATDSAYVGPDKHVIAMDDDRFLKQRKITRRDTMTVDNSMHKVWYDKSNNQVEFFTSPGIHPENGKALKDVTEGILFHHAGQESYADR